MANLGVCCRKSGCVCLGVAAGLAFSSSAAQANLVINAAYTSNFQTTAGTNLSYFEGQVQDAINNAEADIANDVTVNITFDASTTYLGASTTRLTSLSYSTYVSSLQKNQTLSQNDKTALASLPSATNPVPGESAASVYTTHPLLRALGYNSNPPTGSPDGTVYLGLGFMMNPAKTSGYSTQSVAAHEIDEILGIGGNGSQVGSSSNTAPLDLFRYSAPNVRSFSTSATSSYFSINGGATDLVNFNQTSGADYGDWKTGTYPQVQDAFGTPRVNDVLGPNELTALDVIGWTLTSQGTVAEVPEPGSLAFALTGVLGLGLLARQRKTA
ncbi:MAG: hypothetical protein HKL96_11615 [Phycisphaerales bacterium]|nr:hypothetical protein [Phycisphaerales bacterium]